MSFFCKHDWKVLSETTTTSLFEASIKVVRESAGVSSLRLPHQLCEGNRKHIVILTCTKCGKVKRLVTEID